MTSIQLKDMIERPHAVRVENILETAYPNLMKSMPLKLHAVVKIKAVTQNIDLKFFFYFDKKYNKVLHNHSAGDLLHFSNGGCNEEKLQLISFPDQNCLLNRKSELIFKYRHENIKTYWLTPYCEIANSIFGPVTYWRAGFQEAIH